MKTLRRSIDVGRVLAGFMAGLMVAMLAAAQPCRAASVILIKPSAAMNITGKNDVRRLKRLAGGVGWDFSPDALTNAGLKKIGIRVIRLINVDIAGRFTKQGKFILGTPAQFQVGQPARLLGGLATCRAVGAIPHIVIALALPPQLQLPLRDIPKARRAEAVKTGLINDYGPIHWSWYRHYCQAYFKYILIDQKFPDAEFEVGNEPSTSGNYFYPHPPRPAPGSRAAYEAYFKEYKNVARAAESFEKKHRGLHVTLGGPALAWAYTFKFGAFNWAVRFLRDCARQKVKLDFLGLHYYGNISSLDGQYPATYPSFTRMLRITAAARDRYCPQLPIQFTEWGPDNNTTNQPNSMINADNVGAAWSAAFLNTLLQGGVDKALLLVTTDLVQKGRSGQWRDVWGWPSLFTNPAALGQAYPKAIYNVLEMIHRLVGTRVEATRGGKTVGCFASADKKTKRVTVLLWNYGCRIPEGGLPVNYATRQAVVLRIREARAFFGAHRVRFKRWLVSRTMSNAYYLWKHKRLSQHRAALQEVDHGSFRIIHGKVDIGFAMPRSSVSLVEIEAQGEP